MSMEEDTFEKSDFLEFDLSSHLTGENGKDTYPVDCAYVIVYFNSDLTIRKIQWDYGLGRKALSEIQGNAKDLMITMLGGEKNLRERLERKNA